MLRWTLPADTPRPLGIHGRFAAYCDGHRMFETAIRGLGCALFALMTVACAATPQARGPGPDAPVPASEPRGTVRYELDLEPGQGCEREFDLALYEDRRIDLLEWDDRDGCRERRLSVRYFERKISKQQVRALVDDHATKVRELSK